MPLSFLIQWSIVFITSSMSEGLSQRYFRVVGFLHVSHSRKLWMASSIMAPLRTWIDPARIYRPQGSLCNHACHMLLQSDPCKQSQKICNIVTPLEGTWFLGGHSWRWRLEGESGSKDCSTDRTSLYSNVLETSPVQLFIDPSLNKCHRPSMPSYKWRTQAMEQHKQFFHYSFQ